jgi:hypothetical protein
MKNTSFISLFLGLALAAFSTDAISQIVVDAFPQEIKCDVDGLPELPPLTASSPAGKVNFTLSEEIFSGGCLGTLVRTFNFTDPAGNMARAQQFVSITDNEAPKLYGEVKDISTTDDMIPEPTMFASRDNSGHNYDVIFSEKKEDKKITRTWTCTDACGNTATRTQVITIE